MTRELRSRAYVAEVRRKTHFVRLPSLASWFERRFASFVITRERSSLERLRAARRRAVGPFQSHPMAVARPVVTYLNTAARARRGLFRDEVVLIHMGERACYLDICPNCGLQLSIADETCPECGVDLDSEDDDGCRS